MKCPLKHSQQFDGDEIVTLPVLIPRCRKAKCGFVDSDHDSDYLPANCTLLVAALLEPATQQEGT